MKKKIIAGLAIAFAVIAPVSSANALGAGDVVLVGQSAITGQMINWDGNEVVIYGVVPYTIGDDVQITLGVDASNNQETGVYRYMATGTAMGYTISKFTWVSGTHFANGFRNLQSISAAPASYSPMSIFDNVKNWLTGSLLPAIAGLVVLGISVRLAIKAVRKFSKVA